MPSITIDWPAELVAPMRELLVEPGETDAEAIVRHMRIRAAQVAFDKYVGQKDTEFKQLQEQAKDTLNQEIQTERQRLLSLWGVPS